MLRFLFLQNVYVSCSLSEIILFILNSTPIPGVIPNRKPLKDFVSAGFAKTSPMYERKATVAEAFDSLYSSQFYAFTTFSQLGRLCGETHELHPDKTEIKQMQKDVEDYIEQRINKLISEINLEVIPIRKLVRIQVGSVFIALKHLTN